MSARTKVKIDDDVKQVLSQSAIEGFTLKLPGGLADPMPRDLYQRTNKAITALGGKWNKKSGGHVFDYDPRALLSSGLKTGEVRHLKNEYQIFETPLGVARRMVSLAGITDNQQILEPSAGRGAIVRAMQEKITGFLVTAVEIDQRHIDTLNKTGTDVQHADFMTWEREGRFDRIIANPPFRNGQDIDHVTRMFDLLSPGGVVVSIMTPNAHENDTKRSRGFSSLLESSGEIVEELPPGTFSDSGTNVSAMVVRLEKPTSA